jgi:uncharacterized protein YbjQ (UPF0145 family)
LKADLLFIFLTHQPTNSTQPTTTPMQELGADAIVRVQYQCMSGHVTEVMCYGSAVRLGPASSKAA